MLSINLDVEDFLFKDISKEELDLVLNLYNESYDSMFATGKDKDLSFDDIKEKYLEVLINSHEYFSGIHLKNKKEMIGVIKGRIDYDDDEKFWISSFLIGKKYRNEGFGKKCIDAIITYMRETYDVKTAIVGVISTNTSGVSFWKNIGFNYSRTINQFINLNNKLVDFIIMKKNISN